MPTQILSITDQEFINEYRSLNVFHRSIICEACLKSFDKGNEVIKKSIGVEIVYQYVSALEDLAMIFFALKDLHKHENSFLKSLFSIQIRENSKKYSTETLIAEVDRLLSLTFDEMLSELHLPSFDTIQHELNLTKKEAANIEKLRFQYEVEIKASFSDLQKFVSNRKQSPSGEKFDFVTIGNKIKHGNLFLLNRDELAVFYIIDINKDSATNQNLVEGYNLISSNKQTLEFMVKKIKQMSALVSNLLLVFMKYNQ